MGCEQVDFLKQLKRDTPEEEAAYSALEKELLKEHPKHLPLLSGVLASANSLPIEGHPEKLQASLFTAPLISSGPSGSMHRI